MTTMTIISLIALALAQLADVWTTIRGLEAGYTETNPIIRWAMERLGRHGWIAFKLGVAGGLAWLALSLSMPVILWIGAALTGLVAVRNYRLVS
ncbi:hypothetical protein SAMN05421853_10298 [Roseivivax halotolerans]|uniref:DUF5658 domain-containing protein n=1 Tax=Roseivivax halotolerans TaxID=93684 RepID=A0A1I5W387_9RHOB|nr:DUF5658 family protein [Roseivivax halotolerans]SFQ14161.1 hypothetical protein SAMN05421853_10298 [Roseivivax halotolerans]